MLNIFSHSEISHVSASENILHLLDTWYTAIPLYLMSVALSAFLIYRISKSSFSKTYIFTSILLLISGIFLYDTSPSASATGIVLGLMSSSIIVLSSISKS